MRRATLLFWIFSLAAPAFQPDLVILRRLFEESLAKRQREFGSADPRTASS
jgi:hypothetical protein